MKKGSNTRSSLLFEVERLLNECVDLNGELPQILLMENVPQVHSEQNREDFRNWIGFLESIGYSCFYQDLNAKDYGIPQNRERTFMVSCLGDYYYEFPQPFELKLRLKDMLEDEVDEKYYIQNEKAQELIQRLIDSGELPLGGGGTITVDFTINDPKKIEIANCIPARVDCGISNFKQTGTCIVEVVHDVES